MNDRVETTTRADQTGDSLRDWFGFAEDLRLFRDFESPRDEEISRETPVKFSDGPVFITRGHADGGKTTIIVNTREKPVSQSELTFDEVVALAFENPPTGPYICFTIVYRNGPTSNPEGTMVEGGNPVKLQCGMIFNVTATDKS